MNNASYSPTSLERNVYEALEMLSTAQTAWPAVRGWLRNETPGLRGGRKSYVDAGVVNIEILLRPNTFTAFLRPHLHTAPTSGLRDVIDFYKTVEDLLSTTIPDNKAATYPFPDQIANIRRELSMALLKRLDTVDVEELRKIAKDQDLTENDPFVNEKNAALARLVTEAERGFRRNRGLLFDAVTWSLDLAERDPERRSSSIGRAFGMVRAMYGDVDHSYGREPNHLKGIDSYMLGSTDWNRRGAWAMRLLAALEKPLAHVTPEQQQQARVRIAGLALHDRWDAALELVTDPQIPMTQRYRLAAAGIESIAELALDDKPYFDDLDYIAQSVDPDWPTYFKGLKADHQDHGVCNSRKLWTAGVPQAAVQYLQVMFEHPHYNEPLRRVGLAHLCKALARDPQLASAVGSAAVVELTKVGDVRHATEVVQEMIYAVGDADREQTFRATPGPTPGPRRPRIRLSEEAYDVLRSASGADFAEFAAPVRGGLSGRSASSAETRATAPALA